MKLSTFAAIGASAAALLLANGAAAAVVIGSYTLDSGSFGVQTGVHSNGTQTNVTTADAFVNQDNSTVTFSSSAMFSVNGNGEATVDGPLPDLKVDFSKAWGAITFDFESDVDSIMSLTVNGTTLFTDGGGNACGTLCDLSKNGANKFILTGPGITSLSFAFDPSIADAKQFRVEFPGTPGTVPEPATWTMMIVGVGMIGGVLRRRRQMAFAPI
jgi:hypothetical protein